MNASKLISLLALFTLVAFAMAGSRDPNAAPITEETKDAIQPRYLELLKKIVEINSKTENLEGQDKVRQALIPEFRKLGFESKLIALKEGHKLLYFEFPNSQPDLLLVGHSDTVFTEKEGFGNLTIEPGMVKGPGVIDMKGGLVLLLNALTDIKDPQLLKRIRIMINDDEEVGSTYSRARMDELAQSMNAALIFEPGLDDGALVTEESGLHWLTLRVDGKEAHSGKEPENGINACIELAHKLIQVYQLNNFKQHLTVSVGQLSGGSATNKVCGHAKAEIDIRYKDPKDLDQTLQRIDSIDHDSWVKNIKTGKRETTTAERPATNEVPPLEKQSSSGLFESAKAAGSAIGQDVTGRWVGYGSDGNHLAKTGIKVLVGLGPYGSGMHTHEEQMIEHSYSERLKLATGLISKILIDSQHQ